ncbi:MAG: hypothetical protein LBI54_07755 [Lachnospiraceae bacterium]|jgi:hypothetical protein|nr:hypothetical protein [Lachnospiraceae bacterium]
MKARLPELSYLAFLALFLFAKGIGLYDGQPLFRAVLVLAVLCYGVKMLTTKYSVREMTIIGGLLALSAVNYYISGEKSALLYVMMVTGMKNISRERIFRVALLTWTMSFGGMFLLTAAHILDSPFKVHEKFGLGPLLRWGLGQPHPNVLHISYLTFAMLFIYVYTYQGKKVSLWTLALLMLGNVYVFLYSLSSTGLVAVSVLLFLNLYWYFRQKFSLAEKILVSSFLPLCLLLSFAAPLLLTGRAFDLVNRIVNWRLFQARHFLTGTAPSLFGTQLSAITDTHYTMDNSFVFAYVAYGIVMFALIMAAYFLLIHRFLKAGKGVELSLVIAALTAGLTEPFLFNGSFKNVTLLFLGALLYGECQAKPLPELPAIIPKLTAKPRRLIFIPLAAALLGAVLCGLLQTKPEGYIIPRSETILDGEREAYYLASADEWAGQNIKVLGYVNPETRMVLFAEDNLIVLEWWRGVVTAGLLTGLVSLAIVLIRVRIEQCFLNDRGRT